LRRKAKAKAGSNAPGEGDGRWGATPTGGATGSCSGGGGGGGGGGKESSDEGDGRFDTELREALELSVRHQEEDAQQRRAAAAYAEQDSARASECGWGVASWDQRWDAGGPWRGSGPAAPADAHAEAEGARRALPPGLGRAQAVERLIDRMMDAPGYGDVAFQMLSSAREREALEAAAEAAYPELLDAIDRRDAARFRQLMEGARRGAGGGGLVAAANAAGSAPSAGPAPAAASAAAAPPGPAAAPALMAAQQPALGFTPHSLAHAQPLATAQPAAAPPAASSAHPFPPPAPAPHGWLAPAAAAVPFAPSAAAAACTPRSAPAATPASPGLGPSLSGSAAPLPASWQAPAPVVPLVLGWAAAAPARTFAAGGSAGRVVLPPTATTGDEGDGLGEDLDSLLMLCGVEA
jgi:hypothetical protein